MTYTILALVWSTLFLYSNINGLREEVTSLTRALDRIRKTDTFRIDDDPYGK